MSKLRQLSFSLGLDATPAEIPDIGTYAELVRVFNSIHTIADVFDRMVGPLPLPVEDRPYRTPAQTSALKNICRVYLEAAEDLDLKSLVTLNSSGQLIKAQSNGTHDKKARGIVLAGVLTGQYAEVCLQGVIDGFTGLVPNTDYFLSTTAGLITDTAPGGSNTVQYVGYAITSTQMYFHPELHHAA